MTEYFKQSWKIPDDRNLSCVCFGGELIKGALTLVASWKFCDIQKCSLILEI